MLLVADRFLILGLIMAAVCAVSWVTVPTAKFLHYLASSPRLERVRPRAWIVTGAIRKLLVLVCCVVKLLSCLGSLDFAIPRLAGRQTCLPIYL